MILFNGDLCHRKLGQENFINIVQKEYLQVVRQGYRFTFKDHIYEKDDKIFKYNIQTLDFEEIQSDLGLICEVLKAYCIIGSGERCKTCDQINPHICGSCNDGYYLPFSHNDDKTKCKKMR